MRSKIILLVCLLVSISTNVWALDICNEKSTWVVTLSFFDETKAPTIPSSLTYRMDDVLSGTQITADTIVNPSTSTYQLIITPVQNSMLDVNSTSESRRLTVIWQYGGGKQGTAEYIYTVKHLPKVLL